MTQKYISRFMRCFLQIVLPFVVLSDLDLYFAFWFISHATQWSIGLRDIQKQNITLLQFSSRFDIIMTFFRRNILVALADFLWLSVQVFCIRAIQYCRAVPLDQIRDTCYSLTNDNMDTSHVSCAFNLSFEGNYAGTWLTFNFSQSLPSFAV